MTNFTLENCKKSILELKHQICDWGAQSIENVEYLAEKYLLSARDMLDVIDNRNCEMFEDDLLPLALEYNNKIYFHYYCLQIENKKDYIDILNKVKNKENKTFINFLTENMCSYYVYE
jgi:hypothetical protein